METQVQSEALDDANKQPPVGQVAKIKHILSDGVYIKTYLVPAGVRVTSKKFDHAHIIVLAHGSVGIQTPNGPVKYVAPAHYNVPKDTRLEVITLEECTWYCIHPTDETEPEVLWEKY